MRISQKITYAVFFAFIMLFLSMFVKIIPCQTSPDVPNPQYSWTSCNLNPDSNTVTGIKRNYLGYTSSLVEMYIIVLIFFFLVAMLALHFAAKSRQ